jgi:hypothetical protein
MKRLGERMGAGGSGEEALVLNLFVIWQLR